MGIKVDREDWPRLTDKFEYEKTIKDVRNMIKSKLKSEIKRFEDLIEGKGQLQIRFKDEDFDIYKGKITNRLLKYKERKEELETNQFFEK